MIVETREIYRCSHCGKIYLMQYWCEQHEPKCKKNPDNYQPCLDGCRHIEKKEFTFIYDTPHYEDQYQVKVMYCNKKKEAVCPFWHSPYDVLYDKNDEEVTNEIMPEKCEHFNRQ
jgi:hypothetical protein